MFLLTFCRPLSVAELFSSAMCTAHSRSSLGVYTLDRVSAITFQVCTEVCSHIAGVVEACIEALVVLGTTAFVLLSQVVCGLIQCLHACHICTGETFQEKITQQVVPSLFVHIWFLHLSLNGMHKLLVYDLVVERRQVQF